MQKGKINIVMDAAWGSSGKGKFVGYLAQKHDVDASVCNFMTNAGHTYEFEDGRSILFQHIPVSAVNPRTKLFLASSAGITLDIFWKEIETCKAFGIPVEDRLFIDKHAFVIDPVHVDFEKHENYKIASTMKGCGNALAAKILRNGGVRLAKDVPELSPFVTDVSYYLNMLLEKGATIIGETAQGFDLSLNHGTEYPFVTSRDVTPMSFMNDCGVHTHYLGDTYGVIRTFPIRVGNVKDEEGKEIGVSGPCWHDQTELDWGTVSNISGKDILELTSVTKRVRRVFTFSDIQYRKFLTVCRPTHIAINFVNYFKGVDGSTTEEQLFTNEGFKGFYRNVIEQGSYKMGKNAPYVCLFGTGPKNSQIIDLEGNVNRDMPYFTEK